MNELILASSSRWRFQLLARLGLEFRVQPADIDESALENETPVDMAKRLARTKAEKISRAFPESIVIGSDQVCHSEGRVLDKPGDLTTARQQLSLLSGKSASFVSAVCVIVAGTVLEDHQIDRVWYRDFNQMQIDEYLRREPEAISCAGACRAEGLGIAMCRKIDNVDPTSLIGLPLIKLVTLLSRAGIKIP